MKGPRWRRVKRRNLALCEDFLRRRERGCVSVCALFRDRRRGDRFWAFPGGNGENAGLLLCHHRILFPVFAVPGVPAPHFLTRLVFPVPLHAVQGLPSVTDIFDDALEGLGYEKTDQFDYDLMSLDREPDRASLGAGPAGLSLVKPEISDLDDLLPLQADYDRVEVLPRGTEVRLDVSRAGLLNIIKKEHILAAKLGGRIVGKINTNAESFTRFQIGGVYVDPAYRGLGISLRMTAALSSLLLARGKAVTLFVKKHNAAARSVYRKAGFEVNGDYRISYY
jgi:ribosomal protein S18 acetylase RimI-like enzyme